MVNAVEIRHCHPLLSQLHQERTSATCDPTILRLTDGLLYGQMDAWPPATKRATLLVLNVTLGLTSHLVGISSAQTSYRVRMKTQMKNYTRCRVISAKEIRAQLMMNKPQDLKQIRANFQYRVWNSWA